MLLCSSYLNVVLAVAIFDPLSDLLVYDTKINISLKRIQRFLSGFLFWEQRPCSSLHNVVLTMFPDVMTWYSHKGDQDKQEACSSSSGSIDRPTVM
jgi:hypothetical protein